MTWNIFNNFWPKLVTLILSVATWFYAFDEAERDFPQLYRHRFEDFSPKAAFSFKKLPVQLDLVGKAPFPYEVNLEKIRVRPEEVYVFGPKNILDQMQAVETEQIDLAGYTETTELDMGLKKIGHFLEFDPNSVNVKIPVELPGWSSEEEE